MMLIAAQGYGLFLSSIIQNEILVNALIPASVIPMLLFSGFFFNLNDGKEVFRIFELLSLPRYAY